ncbi:MAG: trigger factor [Pseudomonadota bacterium]|jgi:trigger factor|nr:trigger factor [Alphaproteobacteria bacterium]
MQITQSSAEGLKHAFTIIVDAKTLAERTEARLEQIKKTVQIKGFRPGKAPVSLLKKLYGEGVRGEVVQEAVQESTNSALQQHDLRPALQPKIDIVKFGEDADLEYKLEVEVLPVIEPMDFRTLKLRRPVAEVPADAVDESLQRMADQQRSFTDKADDAVAENGDVAVIDYAGTIDGEPFEGGKSENVSVLLGRGGFIPGFEEQLLGVKKGDEKELHVTFPEDYGAKKLAGKEAVFAVKVHQIRGSEPVAIDDALAEKLGMENLEKLREALSERIAADFKNVSRARLKRALLDELDKAHVFEVPPGMLASEEEQIWQQFQQEMQRTGQTLEDQDKSEEELRADYRKIADRRVRLGLLLAEIGQRNNITVSEDALREALFRQAAMFPGQEKALFEYYQQNPQALASLRAPLYEDKVIDFILELAEVTDSPVSKEELLKDPEGED